MVLAVESESDQSVSDHSENQTHVAKVKCGLRQDGFTGKQRLGNPTGNVHGLVVVPVVPIGKANEGNRCPQCPSRPREPLARGEILRPAHGPGQTHKGLGTVTGPRIFQLVTYELAL